MHLRRSVSALFDPSREVVASHYLTLFLISYLIDCFISGISFSIIIINRIYNKNSFDHYVAPRYCGCNIQQGGGCQ